MKLEVGFKMDIGLADEQRDGASKLLNTLLADEYLLYTKTRNYHWNVIGRQFNDLHKFFEGQYEQLDGIVDDVAERIRALGHKSAGTLSEFAKNSRLQESPGKYPDARGMIADLHKDHETVIRHLRADLVLADKSFGDIGTNNFLTDLLEKHEKMAWMLRSFLQEE